MKKLLLFLAILILLFSGIHPGEGQDLPYMTTGSHGEEVKVLKKRLYALNYYKTDNFSGQYTEDTAEKVRLFQRLNGLEETGCVDAATAAALYSDNAVPMPRPTMVPLTSPGPTPAVSYPQRDEEGFLAAPEEYIYENDTEGLWIYLSQDLQVIITRQEDSRARLEWFETEILTRNGQAFRTVMTDPQRPGKNFMAPYEIAGRENLVLGFSDDFYGNRMNNGENTGIIIREGQILSEKTNKRTGHHLPNLDMMAQYPDGTLAVYDCGELTAADLMDRGAVNVFSFGPWLLRDGKINDLVYTYYKSIEPRQALGMIAPGHYLLVSVQGRRKDSEGTTLQRVAELMQQRGVTQALNLDGGNTMALIFRGRMLNKLAVYKNKKFIRSVTSLIGIGTTQEMAD